MNGEPEPVVELLTETTLKRVRPGRASGIPTRLVIAAWLLGLAGVAGFAVAGRLPGPVPAPVPALDEPTNYANPPVTHANPPINHANPTSAAEVRPTLGEDGLMGGLVFADS